MLCFSLRIFVTLCPGTVVAWLIIAPAKARARTFRTGEVPKIPSCKFSEAFAHLAHMLAPNPSKKSASAPHSYASLLSSMRFSPATPPLNKHQNRLIFLPELLRTDWLTRALHSKGPRLNSHDCCLFRLAIFCLFWDNCVHTTHHDCYKPMKHNLETLT